MSMSSQQNGPPIIIAQVRLPDRPKNGRYNELGKPDEAGSVFVVEVGPTMHAWAVFPQDLLPGQAGTMIFDNVSGTGLLDVIVSQWIRGGKGLLGENLNQPHVGEAVILHLARQRARNAVKVAGQNSSKAAVSVAAGLLYIPGTGG
jgi:hypothetical protein